MPNNDAELIQQTLDGDQRAFSALVQKYQKPVHALVWRKIGDFHTAEEITQDIFLNVYKKLQTLKNPNLFAGWLYVSAARRCLAWLKKKRIPMESLEGTSSEELEALAYSQYYAEQQEEIVNERQREVVKRLLQKLPESERTVVTLHYLGDMSCEDISKFLGVSPNTVKSRLHRARKRLKKEEQMVRENLGGFELPMTSTENILQEIARIKPTAPAGGKPWIPWAIAASTTALVVLLIGSATQYLTRFQQPYSFEATSEMTVELIDTSIVRASKQKLSPRNQVGNSDTPGKNSGRANRETDAFQVGANQSEQPEKPAIINAKESTVRLVGLPGGGTGFFVTPDKIATNFHVAAGMAIGPIFAKLGHKETIWTVEGVTAFDAKSDIAILKIQGQGVPLPLADIDTLQVGETVFLAGYPNLAAYKVTEGVVKDIRSSDKWLKTTVEAYPGNSGSPMLNSKGEAIGIHVGHGYDARPSNAIKALLAGSTSMEPLAQWRKRKTVQAYSHYQQGWKKYYDGNAEGAIKDFNQAIELTPDDVEIYKLRAQARLKLGEHQAAIEDYNQAIKLNPEDAALYKGRAKAKSDSGNHTGAIADYNQALKINPNAADTYKKRGKARAELEDDEGAIEDYTHAIKLNPNDAEVYKNRGKARAELGDDEGKIEDYTQALQLRPQDVFAYNDLANTKRKLGDYAGAIADYTHAIEKLKDGDGSFTYDTYSEHGLGKTTITPDDSYIYSIYSDRANAKRKLEDYAGAIADYTHIIERRPNPAYAYRDRADVKHELEDYTGAIEDYTQAIKLNPNDAEAYKSRGKARAELGDDQGKIEDYTQALQLRPQDVFAYEDLADTKRKLGDYAGAIADYTHAIEKLKDGDGSFTYDTYSEYGSGKTTITPDDSYIYYTYNNRGWAKREFGDHEGAIEDFTQAIELKPEDAYAYNNRADVKRELEDYTGAIADYSQAIELNPAYAIAYHNRGLAKAALGQHDAAKIDFKKAKEIAPEVRKEK